MAAALVLGLQIDSAALGGSEHWVGTWATSVLARPSAAQPPLSFKNQTLRQIVHGSIGGRRVRVVLSNAFGTAPLSIGAGAIALRSKEAALTPDSSRTLTFSGGPSIRIPPGAVVVSDPVNLVVPPLADIAIDVYLPDDTAATSSPLTTHTRALQTNYVSEPGNHAGAPLFPVSTTVASWFFLARVEVDAPVGTSTIVTIGDSITDGANSTPDTNRRWPDHLAKRLNAQGGKVGVINLGISGNRMLTDGLGTSCGPTLTLTDGPSTRFARSG